MEEEEQVVKKKYNTKKQDPVPWNIAGLADGPASIKNFYPASQFYIYKVITADLNM